MTWKIVCAVYNVKKKLHEGRTAILNSVHSVKLAPQIKGGNVSSVKSYGYPALVMGMAFLLIGMSFVPAISGMNVLADDTGPHSLTVDYKDGSQTTAKNGEPLNAAVLHFHVEHEGVVDNAYVTLKDGTKVEWEGHGGENVGEENEKARWHWVLTPSGILTISGIEKGADGFDSDKKPSCPLDGEYVVDFSEWRLANRDSGSLTSKTPWVDVNIPEGEYTITAVTWDRLSLREQNQENERSFIVVDHEGGKFETLPTNNIPDGPDVQPGENIVTTTIASDTSFQDISRIKAKHIGTGSSAGSHHLICVSFEPKADPDPEDPNLEIDKSVNKKEVNPGDEVVYTIELTNTGGEAAIELGVEDVLPSVVTTNTETNWDIGELQPNETWDTTYTATVSENAEAGKYTNTATAVAKNHPPVSDTAQIKVEVKEEKPEPKDPKLEIEKTADRDTVKPAGEITYTIVVSNTGEGTAVNVEVVDILPAGFTAGEDTSWNIGDLEPSESWEHSFTAQVSENIEHGEYKNVAKAQAKNHDEVKDHHVAKVDELPVIGISGVTHIAIAMWSAAIALFVYGARLLYKARKAGIEDSSIAFA